MKKYILTIVALVVCSTGVVFALNIDATNKYAWGENIGWVNFGTAEGDVDVSTTAMDGYAWGENVGWISLTCANTSSCGTIDYGVTISGATVAGYAWGENVGWISFNCSNTASCGTVDYGVTIDTLTGVFSGYAWGQNVGWIVFNCATTGSCGAVDYKLQTTSGVTPTPTATATPTPTATVVVSTSPPPGPVLPPPPPPTPTSTPTTTPTSSPRATPTASPRITPLPTPIVSPRISPGVTPTTFPTPTTRPPGATPASSPPVTTGIPPVVDVIDGISGGFDSFGGWLTPGGDALCAGPLGVAACATTAIPTVAIALAFVAAFLQSEWLAAGYSLLQFFGVRRKTNVWGVVYDARTKRPIPLAKLELFNNTSHRLLETRYADRDGRYGFLTSPASLHEDELHVQMRVSKPGFVFPSASMITGTDFIVYDNIYRGGEIVMKGDSVLSYNIPMDSMREHRLSLLGFGQSLISPIGEKLLALGFYLGLVTVPLNLWLAPSTKNLGIAIVFIGVNALRSFVLLRPHGITTDAQTGKRMSFALVVLNDMQGSRQGFAVSDEHGRFILSGEQGIDYEIIASTPANVIPQRSIRMKVRGIRRMSSRAWITNNLRI